MRILVVDDNPVLCDLLERALTGEGDVVSVAMTAREADARVAAEPPFDVIVLDLALPDAWGTDWCRKQRQAGVSAMVLTLTANSELERRLDAFEAGVDDFLAKPFAVAELRARVRALGRRGARPRRRAPITTGDASIDLDARKATRAGAAVTLTEREWRVLERLALDEGRVVSRQSLLEDVWGTADETTRASLDVIVGRIRKKLGADFVRTLRGNGYALGS